MNSTRLRRSGMLKIFCIELKIGLLSSGIVFQTLNDCRISSPAGISFRLLCNYLNGAARFLDLFHGALAELVRANMEGMRQFSDTQNFHVHPGDS